MENFRLKLFSVVLAVLLELYFYSPDNSVTTTINANIDLRNVPQAMMVVEPKPGEKGLSAKVTVRGPGPLVEQLTSYSHRFLVEVPPNVQGAFEGRLNPRDLRLPSGIHVVNIEPTSVDFRLERVVEKQLVVVAEHVGDPAPGFRLAGIDLDPEMITARGPESELSGLSLIETQKIDLTGMKAPATLSIALQPKGNLSVLSTSTVGANIRIVQIQAEKSVSGIPVSVVAPKLFAASVEPSSIAVVVSGPPKTLESVVNTAIEVVADAAQLQEGKFEVKPKVKLPEGINLIQTNPESVTVNVVKK